MAPEEESMIGHPFEDDEDEEAPSPRIGLR